jgi:hypothetical protein
MEEFWISKLSPLVERDHFIREGLLTRGILSDAYHKEMEKVHVENAHKLKALIEKNGFPVLSNAGEKGVRLAWIIIMHSISLPDFIRECLTQMRLAAASQDYTLELLAYTEDRVLFFEGKPQLYGTNYDWEEGEMKPTPIQDISSLPYRRRSMGLPPMPAEVSRVTEERPPKDPVKKAQEFELWLKKVGWRV